MKIVITHATGSGYQSAQETAVLLRRKLRAVGAKTDLLHEIDPNAAPPDLAIAVGGDGTVIDTAKRYSKQQVPTIGFNAGTVAFMAANEVGAEDSFVDLVVNKKYHIESRLSLKAEFNEYMQGPFLNEVLLSHPTSLARYRVEIDGITTVWNNLFAKGIMVSTATGSTAWNASNNGPIALPDEDTIILTALSPQTMNVRSVVTALPHNSRRIKITVVWSKYQEAVQCLGDAQPLFEHEAPYALHEGICEGDSVYISRGYEDLLIATRGLDQFFTAMREKKGFAH